MVTDSGDAHAGHGGTAVTGHRGPPPPEAAGAGTVRVEKTGTATASAPHAVAISGNVHVAHVDVHAATAPEPVQWPLQPNPVPALASAFQNRAELRERIDHARADHASVVLSGGGGTGKSQLAAAYAHQARADGVDLVLWVNAADTEQVITSYATAARLVAAPGAAGADAEDDARAFVNWLATTSRSWLVVLDDITHPRALEPWWPPAPSRSGSGRVSASTRRREALLSGGGRVVIDVDTYTQAEAEAYLRERLTRAGKAHLLDEVAPRLARELGLLPLALAHAAAYMINEDVTCGRYLRLFTAGTARLDKLLPQDADTEQYGRPVAAALLLSLDAAQLAEPAGLAAPALTLAAFLDPAGHPRSLWTHPGVLDHLDTHRTPTPGTDHTRVDAEGAHAVLRLLHRYGLITDDSRNDPRAVRIHALTARAIREGASDAELPALARTAADALLGMWPEQDHTDTDLAAVLRTNTHTLATHAGDLLWHPILYRTGKSLLDTGLHSASTAHWERTTADAERLLGEEHPDTLAARADLAVSYLRAGRTGEAIALQERVLADSERLLGEEHPDTLTARANLAVSYSQAGRTGEAIALLERGLADSERLLGEEHPDTLTARANLAVLYSDAGRTGEATALQERVLADRERLLGEEHPKTLTARANLAVSYWQAGRTGEAIALQERVLADRERLLGEEHPDTLTAAANLAASYWQAGRTGEAIALQERGLADSEQLLGEEHPDTLTERANLAVSYWQAGRTGEAIALLERVLADRERLLGEEHPDTLKARANLAVSYSQAGRTGEAIAPLERVLADRERLLGEEHPDTLKARANLAVSYSQAGRTGEAIALQERGLADSEQLLGEEHPDTLTERANLAVSYWRAGRTGEAIALQERGLADRERLLGEEHPDTLTAAANLAASYWQAGRTGEAIALLERVLADRERLLGEEHPDTVAVADELRRWTLE
ncbi:tetratricopeptide repeat protein [Embleya sp. NPDC050493]|uniref:tetratricopeptide repeat protein n=1 Tax=Embleya sp. NPDC050493 TaxID=3363989 RepID=UPI0037878B87